MFERLLERVDEDVQVVKNVLTLHDELRARFYKPLSLQGDLWLSVRGADPTKLAWQIYDHCAAFTRLYSVYEQFVEDLVTEYLSLLPSMYEKYDLLPEMVSKQHRQGIGQILSKIGKDGPYRHLQEKVIVAEFSRGVQGEARYKLISDAFFVDRQNYRLDVVQRVLATLGFDQIAYKIERSISLSTFLSVERSGAQTVGGELAEFIRYRNEAAHMEVTNVASTNEIKSKADFIVLFCRVLADLAKEEFYRRKQEVGQFDSLGKISEVFLAGTVGVVMLNGARLAVHDEVIISYPGPKKRFIVTKILSLQFYGVDCAAVTAKGEQEVGVGFDLAVRRGGELRRLVLVKDALSEAVTLEVIPESDPLIELETEHLESALEESPDEDEDGNLSI